MIKKIIILTFLFVAISLFSQQKNINNYKYVIIPSQFEWLKSPDQYQVNSLTKFLFKKYGFIAFLSEEELPKDVSVNRCLALTALVKDNSGLFSTKSKIELKDCTNKTVFTSVEGRSKLKDYKKAYHEAIRKAFISIQKLNYSFVPASEQKIIEVEEIVPAVVNPNVQITQKKEVEIKKISNLNKNIFYAKTTTLGYELVNETSKEIFSLLKSSNKDVLFLKNKSGIVFKSEGKWFIEFYENDTLKKQEINIRF